MSAWNPESLLRHSLSRLPTIRTSGGAFSQIEATTQNTIWERLKQAAIAFGVDARISERSIDLGWSATLDLIREYGTKALQQDYGYRFRPEGEALNRIKEYAQQFRKVREAQGSLRLLITDEEIEARLKALDLFVN